MYRHKWVDYDSTPFSGSTFTVKANTKSKAIVVDNNDRPATFRLLGMIRSDKSRLGHYGNLWRPQNGPVVCDAR